MKGVTSALTIEANRIYARLQFNTRRRLRLYREFSGLLESGIARGEALEILWRIGSSDGTKPNEPVAVVLDDARNGVRNGLAFVESLKSWIPSEDYMLIQAIEESDGFAGHLEAWCDTLDSRNSSLSGAFGALVYPVFLIVVAYGLLIYFDRQIMPSLDELLPREQWTGTAAMFQTICAAASKHAVAVAALCATLPVLLSAALPRWSGAGRNWADFLPFFSLYRSYSGLSFLQAMGALTSSGLSASESILRIRNGASQYARTRLDAIRTNLLNGNGLGESMLAVEGGWPNQELALSMRTLANCPDFPAQMLRTAKDWRRVLEEHTEQTVAVWRMLAFLAVFFVISGVVASMYEIQGQIAAGIR